MNELFVQLFAVDWGGLIGAAVASGVGLSAVTQLLKAQWIAVPARRFPRSVSAALAVLVGIISTISVGLELSSLASFIVFSVVTFVSSGIAYDVVKKLVSEIKEEPLPDDVTKLGTVVVDVQATGDLKGAKEFATSTVKAGLKNAMDSTSQDDLDLSTTENSETETKSVEDVAQEVIDGQWGGGADRKNQLEAEGYNYDEVQAKVRELVAKNK